MTGIEALQKALEITQQIEVKGKQNLANLFYVMQLLEGLLDLQKGGEPDGNNDQAAVESGISAEG